MATKMFMHRFIVEGSGIFPVDMLRYNSCWPTYSEDVFAIMMDHTDPEYLEPRKATISAIASKGWKPTEGRWASFGWRVIDHKVRSCIND